MKQDTLSMKVETKPRKQWKEYDILSQDLYVNGDYTDQQIITYKGKYVTTASNLYRVLPNEDVLKIGDKVAKMQKAKFYEPASAGGTRNWYRTDFFGSHVMTNPKGTQMVANYMFPEKVDVTGGKDFVQFGFMLRNGIDKKTAFTVSPMTVRMTCDNIMYHVASSRLLKGLEDREGAYNGLEKVEQTQPLKDQHTKINAAKGEFSQLGVRKLHFRTLTLDFVEEAVERIKIGADTILKRYQQMVDMKMSQRQAELLVKNLPKVVLKDLPYINVNYDKLHEINRVKILERKNPESGKLEDPVQWDVFNDITNSLTFAQRRAFNANLGAYHALDRIIVQQVR